MSLDENKFPCPANINKRNRHSIQGRIVKPVRELFARNDSTFNNSIQFDLDTTTDCLKCRLYLRMIAELSRKTAETQASLETFQCKHSEEMKKIENQQQQMKKKIRNARDIECSKCNDREAHKHTRTTEISIQTDKQPPLQVRTVEEPAQVPQIQSTPAKAASSSGTEISNLQQRIEEQNSIIKELQKGQQVHPQPKNQTILERIEAENQDEIFHQMYDLLMRTCKTISEQAFQGSQEHNLLKEIEKFFADPNELSLQFNKSSKIAEDSMQHKITTEDETCQRASEPSPDDIIRAESKLQKEELGSLKQERLKDATKINALQEMIRASTKTIDDYKSSEGVGGQVCLKKNESSFRNVNSTCFMNAILQMLFHTSRFTERLLQQEHNHQKNAENPCFTCGMREVYGVYLTTRKSFPDFFIENLHIICPNMKIGEHQDATEFLVQIIVRLDSEMPPNSGTFGDLFKFYHYDVITCSNCGKIDRTSTAFSQCLSLPVTGEHVNSIEEAMKEFLKEEIVENRRCNQCGGSNQSATKRLQLESIPKILLVDFKRSVFVNPLEQPKKITKEIAIVDKMDVSCERFGTLSLQLSHAIQHIGSAARMGHCIAWTRDQDRNFATRFDDVTVSRHNISDMLKESTENAHLLAYKQVDESQQLLQNSITNQSEAPKFEIKVADKQEELNLLLKKIVAGRDLLTRVDREVQQKLEQQKHTEKEVEPSGNCKSCEKLGNDVIEAVQKTKKLQDSLDKVNKKFQEADDEASERVDKLTKSHETILQQLQGAKEENGKLVTRLKIVTATVTQIPTLASAIMQYRSLPIYVICRSSTYSSVFSSFINNSAFKEELNLTGRNSNKITSFIGNQPLYQGQLNFNNVKIELAEIFKDIKIVSDAAHSAVLILCQQKGIFANLTRLIISATEGCKMECGSSSLTCLMKLSVKDEHNVAEAIATKFNEKICEECCVSKPKIIVVMIHRESLSNTTALEDFERITINDSIYVLESFVSYDREEKFFTSSISVNTTDFYRHHNGTATKTNVINAATEASLLFFTNVDERSDTCQQELDKSEIPANKSSNILQVENDEMRADLENAKKREVDCNVIISELQDKLKALPPLSKLREAEESNTQIIYDSPISIYNNLDEVTKTMVKRLEEEIKISEVTNENLQQKLNEVQEEMHVSFQQRESETKKKLEESMNQREEDINASKLIQSELKQKIKELQQKLNQCDKQNVASKQPDVPSNTNQDEPEEQSPSSTRSSRSATATANNIDTEIVKVKEVKVATKRRPKSKSCIPVLHRVNHHRHLRATTR